MFNSSGSVIECFIVIRVFSMLDAVISTFLMLFTRSGGANEYDESFDKGSTG